MAKRLYNVDGVKLEAGVKEDIRKWLVAHRIYSLKGIKRATDALGFFYMPVQNGMGLTGVSDFMICYNGVTIAVETKASDKPARATSDQQAFIDAIKKAGGYGVCVNNVEMLALWWDKELGNG